MVNHHIDHIDKHRQARRPESNTEISTYIQAKQKPEHNMSAAV